MPEFKFPPPPTDILPSGATMPALLDLSDRNEDAADFEIDDLNAAYLRDRTLLRKAQQFLSDQLRCDAMSLQPERTNELDLDNITGLFIGVKDRYGLPTGELAVVVTVAIKSAMHNVSRRAQIPPSILVDGRRVLTDVIQEGVGEFTAQCGSLMGPLTVNPEKGTMGAIVQLTGSATKYVLSNSHVMSDFGVNPTGTKFYVPVLYPPNGTHVCSLVKNVPLQKWNPNFPNGYNIVDCALGTANALNTQGYLKGIGAMNPSPVLLGLNSVVLMSGGATGVRKGVVKGVDAQKDFQFNGATYQFRYTYAIASTDGKGLFSQFGDSGALVVSSSIRPAGLIMGTAVYSYACKIGNVMQKLGISNFVP